MKKTLLGIFLVLGASAFANHKLELKGAYDLGGEYKFDGGASTDSKASSGEVGAEYRYEVTPGLELGAGTAFQFHDKLKDYNGKLYNSVPIYGTAKYTFDTPTVVKPYVKGDLGYSINTKNAKDGLYYGAGAGVNVNNFNVEVMYKENQAKYDSLIGEQKANYRRVSLGVGYDFSLGY